MPSEHGGARLRLLHTDRFERSQLGETNTNDYWRTVVSFDDTGRVDVPTVGVPCVGAAADSRRLCRCNLVPLDSAEKEALAAFYNSTNGQQWRFNDGWMYRYPYGDPVRDCDVMRARECAVHIVYYFGKSTHLYLRILCILNVTPNVAVW